MNEPLENLYFNWLYSKVNDPSNRSPSFQFQKLLGELHRTEFVWLVSGDDNRAEDGCELRFEFLREARLDADASWLNEGCSVLEMFVAFSRRAAFETDDRPRKWFWIMLDNLDLAQINDTTRINYELIKNVLDTFVWRTYNRNGVGGIFPLRNSRADQRKVEIWYQFSEYLYEQECG